MKFCFVLRPGDLNYNENHDYTMLYVKSIENYFNNRLKVGKNFITLVDIARQINPSQYSDPSYLRYGLMPDGDPIEFKLTRETPYRIEYEVMLDPLPI